MKRHQLISGDLSEHPRPGETEIYQRPVYRGHLERAESSEAQTCPEQSGRKDVLL